MTDEEQKKRDWLDIWLKVLSPIVAGLLIAWAGIVGKVMLSEISSNQESARLITELQIKREQAESELRKDVFDQALSAFLLKKQGTTGSLEDMSKQLLRLELLALNFGDSLSLSPLFSEFKKDMEGAEPVSDKDRLNYSERKYALQKRLDSLAKRVASAQLSSIAQHGVTKEIIIPLYEYRLLSKDESIPCSTALFESSSFAWPDFEVLKYLGEFNNEYKPVDDEAAVRAVRNFDEYYAVMFASKGLVELNGVKRQLELHVSDVNHCKKTAKIQIIVSKGDPANPEVNRSFTLDYFNFPMVDNTRLSDNHRFAIVMEDFNVKGDEPGIEITGVVFPSEYASLRDRPGMKEARQLLESALKREEDDSDD